MRLRGMLVALVFLVFWGGGSWAQEAAPVSGADTATLPSEQKPAALLPDISFAILEDGRVGIQAVGFTRNQVSRFIFDGQDVTGVIEDLKGNGILEGTNVVIEDAEGTIYPANGFEMKLSVDSSILDGHSFGVVLINGLELHKTVVFSGDKGRYGNACATGGLGGAAIGGGLGAVGGAGIGSWLTAPVGLGVGFASGCVIGLIGEWFPW